MIAVGTGGIKPCVSSFGGDQFTPEQVIILLNIKVLFYFWYVLVKVDAQILKLLITKNYYLIVLFILYL